MLTLSTLREGFPRDAVLADLTAGFAPRKVVVREQGPRLSGMDLSSGRDTGMVVRQPKAPHAPRTRVGKGRAYTVVGHYRPKRNTWTALMVDIMRAWRDTREAEQALGRTTSDPAYGLTKYASKRLDWTWAVTIGLIRWEA